MNADNAEQPSDAVRLARAERELKGFAIDVTIYTEDDLHKVVTLLLVYQTALERLRRK